MIWASVLNILANLSIWLKPSPEGLARRDKIKRYRFLKREAKKKDSPGGKEITPEERARMNEELDEL